MSLSLMGIDALGASVASVASAPRGPYLTIRFLDPKGLVKKEGGAAGAIAYQLIPGTVEGKIYDETKRQMEGEFKARGVAAELKVVSDVGLPPRRDLVVGAAVGVVGYALLTYLFRERS